MTEHELHAFIEAVTSYFTQITGKPADIGIPFVKKDDPVVLDYTGLIGISGPRRGGIYLTSEPNFLIKLTQAILELPEPDEESLLDMVGEWCNTIAGNVRKNFGPDFLISVPMLIRGRPQDILLKLKPPVFVIPILWHQEKSFLVVGLE